MKKILNNKKGFTLMELIIVVAVMVILAAIAIPNYMSVLKQADEAKVTAAARNAFSLAQIELLNAKIDDTYTTDTLSTLNTDIATDLGADTVVIVADKDDKFIVYSAKVVIDNHEAWVTNGDTGVGEKDTTTVPTQTT